MIIPHVNLLGFLALCCYFLTLLPTLVRIIMPRFKREKLVLLLQRYRRQVGLLVFLLSVGHGLSWLMMNHKDIFEPNFLWNCWHGILLLVIFGLLAATSNNWSIKIMKKNWKRLHALTYVAMFVMGLHVWDKMSIRWSILTPFSLCLVLASIGLFGIRVWIQRTTKKINVDPASPS
ncbi:MAG: ferric reductase-like transmembrane domain-containing protein [Cyanobacteria bacterium P01_A01_bin.17]